MKVQVGDKVFIPNQKKPFTVQARDERYIICTKPYNPKRTVMYFIVDLVEKRRGPDNMVFCFGYETREDCEKRLQELNDSEHSMAVSWRRGIPLDIDIE